MSEPEPDWTQTEPTQDQIRAWMRERAAGHSAEELARLAFDHFARPFHPDALFRWAEIVKAEQAQ